MSFFNLNRLVSIVCFIILTACSAKHPSINEINQNINKLNDLVISLSSSISKNEALDFSNISIKQSLNLSHKYKAISSPWLQNTLVNIGIKKRGLCHEWTEDLLTYLLKRNYKTLSFHAIGANIGYLNEHNALSVSAKGEGIKNSIVLDAWRHSGNLYFQKIEEDRAYDWKERKGLYGVLPLKSGK